MTAPKLAFRFARAFAAYGRHSYGCPGSESCSCGFENEWRAVLSYVGIVVPPPMQSPGAERRIEALAWSRLAEIERTGESPFHAKHSGKPRHSASRGQRKEKS